MKLPFSKYHSLENHFILFDTGAFTHTQKEWLLKIFLSQEKKIQKLCHTRLGIGADGILLLTEISENHFLLRIFNADGTEAENCLNGLRCAVFHIIKNKKKLSDWDISQAKIFITITTHTFFCHYDKTTGEIITFSPAAHYHREESIELEQQKKITGSVLSIGNPHFIITQEMNSEDTREKKIAWLGKYGHTIECHERFAHKTNVELLWQEKNQEQKNNDSYYMIIHERGVGMTAACSSGVACALWLLYVRQKIEKDRKISIIMPGGQVVCWITQDEKIALQATAHHIFDGFLPIDDSH